MTLGEMMLAVARSAANLQVVTAVGAPTLTGALDAPNVALPPQPDHCIVTNVNLVAGDVTVVVSPGFLQEDAALARLRADHGATVTAAQAAVAANLTALVALVKQLGDGMLDRTVAARGSDQTRGA
jgi:hypothetical protein